MSNTMSGKLERQLVSFMDSALSKSAPKWIITAERKGTALLRCYTDALKASERASKIWQQTISSQVLKEFPDDQLKDGNVLVIDEGTYSGANVTRTLELLEEKKGVPRSRIKIAVFGVHEQAPHAVDHRWYGQLNESRYRAVRQEIVNYFQRKGSLLLDTEHVEVVVKLNCGRLEFFDALGGLGPIVQHASGGNRINITVSNPRLVDEEELAAALPVGAITRDVVKKVRVVERSTDSFAILPIFYPSVPQKLPSEGLKGLESCLSERESKNPETNFHLVGLHSAIFLFRSIFAALAPLILREQIEVSIAKPGGAGDAISHIGALFRGIDLDALHHYVCEEIERGRSRGLKKAERSHPIRIEAADGSADDQQMFDFEEKILTTINYWCDQVPGREAGPTLLELRGNCGADESDPRKLGLFSAAMDRLVDAAKVVPEVATLPFRDGIRRVVRTFRIDGEIVSGDVRRVAWSQRKYFEMGPRA